MTPIADAEPKKKRNWPFWLAAIAMVIVGLGLLVAVWFASGRAELRRATEELKASGLRTTTEEIAPPAVPSAQNAAVLYAKAWALEKTISGQFGPAAHEIQSAAAGLDEIPPARWPKEDKRRLGEYIEAMAPVIDLTKAAARLERCRFPLDYNQGMMMLFPHLSRMRKLSRLMHMDSLDKLGKGEAEGAIESALDGLRAASHSGSDQTLIGSLVASACQAIALEAVDAVICYGSPTQEQLQRLLAGLDEHAFEPPLRAILESELWCGLDAYTRVRTRELPASHVQSMTGAGAASRIPWRWVADRDEARYIRTMLEFADLIDRPYLEADPQAEAIVSELDSASWHIYPMMKCLAPGWSAILTSLAEGETRRQIRRLGAALVIYEKRHGRLPDTLERLAPEIISEAPVDPFSGKTYVYRQEGNGFVVYSLGRDMQDNRGVPRSQSSDKWDIVFRYKRK